MTWFTILSESEQVDGDVNRIGVLLSLVADIDDSAVGGIRSVLLAPGVTLGRRRFEVMFLDRMPWQDYEVNRRMRLAISQQSNKAAQSLELTIDYSTVPGQNTQRKSALGRYLPRPTQSQVRRRCGDSQCVIFFVSYADFS